MQRNRAFTLIELLVVVSIVGLLASVVMASLNSARSRASTGAGLQFEANVYHASGDQAVGLWEFDECSGTTAYDRSGYANTGTLTSGAAFSTDTPRSRGCSVSLDGSDDYVNIADSTSMTFSGDVTITAWIKPTSSGGGSYRTFLAKRGGTGTNYEMFLNQSNGALSWYNGGLYISSYIPTLNIWTHVAGVINGTTLTLYVNGAPVYTSAIAASSALTGNPFTIGRAGTSAENYAGLIDSVRVYSKSLVAGDIKEIYAQDLREGNLARE